MLTSIMAASLLSKVAQGTEAKKILDLEKDTRNYQDGKNRIASDWGVKQTSTDDWLKCVSEGPCCWKTTSLAKR